ncbi:MAG: twin-arginine translocase subunit TatB [Halomonadaceae bacterium]|nr:MAG: twin-arginine translocase subunit TatB [Halomonadaceae bacterium]
MFDLGFAELVIVLVVALLVVGPERLPRLVRMAGLMVGKAKAALADVSREIERELPTEEVEEIKAVGEYLRSSNVRRRQPMADLKAQVGLQDER